MSVILTAFADLTLKMTDILKNKKDNSVLKIEKKRVDFLVFLQFLSCILANFYVIRIKFVFSKKATKIDEIFTIDLTLTTSSNRR